MLPRSNGSIRLFQFQGITVFLHWSWFLVAWFMIQWRADRYPTLGWAMLEYVGLFCIVLLHEFGHALACRQTGGQAREILLWPLGGVAYVQPPNRPGPILWSIAAGPLVNVALIPVFLLAQRLCLASGLADTTPPLLTLITQLGYINLVVLIFNLLPIYPLDGGQILRSLLWFPLGESKSLKVATVIGMLGAGGILVLAVMERSLWIGIMGLFAAHQSWQGFQRAGALSQYERIPRHNNLSCPSCGEHPIAGDYWNCGECGTKFDAFATAGRCPQCHSHYTRLHCPRCQTPHPFEAWERGRS